MKSRITRNDMSVIGLIAAVLIAAGAIAWQTMGPPSIFLFGVACVVAVLWAQFESMRRTSEQLTQLRKDAFDDYRQVESLLSLIATLDPKLPLPPLRDHSASPDFLRHAISLMLKHKPRLTVELGSGSSTVFLAYCLKKVGGGKLISVDHDAHFAERTRAMIEAHELGDYVTVVHSPLDPVLINGSEYRWYSLKNFDPGEPIEMLIIDGPPYHVHPLARYPAIPLMLPHMTEDSIALMDDANRPEELRIAQLWKEQFPGLAMSSLDAEKGALLVARSASGAADGSRGKV